MLGHIIIAPGQGREPHPLELRERLKPCGDLADRMQRGLGLDGRRPAGAIPRAGSIVRLLEQFGILTGLVVALILVDARTDDVCALPRVNPAANVPEHIRHSRAVGLGNHEGADRLATARQLRQPRQIKAAEPCHRGRARNRRGRHNQQMRDLLTALQQGFALFDAESVLFVDDRKGKIRRLECPRKRGVRGNDDARLAAGRRRERFATCRKLHAAGDQRDRNVKSRLADHAADGFGVLLGEHLRGGDKHRLIA